MTGHIMLTFTDKDLANKAILNGLRICSKRITITRNKKEPVRCLQCQQFGHIVAQCAKKTETCAICGMANHRSAECKADGHQYCVLCKADDHSSWSRECPTFIRKCDELDQQLPENTSHFFPSTENWTRQPPAEVPAHLEKTTKWAGYERSKQQKIWSTWEWTSTADHTG